MRIAGRPHVSRAGSKRNDRAPPTFLLVCVSQPAIFEVTAVSKVRAIDIRGKAAAPLDTPTDLSAEAVREISKHLNAILATTFALYLKTKNFHWHVSGPHFRDYHLLLDEQGEQIFASTDDIAERVRKIGGTTLRSISQISELQGIEDNDEDYVAPGDMLSELVADNKNVVAAMRECHEVCDKHGDVATASILENFIDQAERRVWFMFEASRKADESGH
jgi:starvation-inducible DNA-binding protein